MAVTNSAAVAAPCAPNGYATPAKAMLWLDLVFCCFVGLNAVLAAGVIFGYNNLDYLPMRAAIEMITGGGIAFFGITGNLLLLRKRRAGLLFASVALLFVVAGIGGSYVALPQMLAKPEELPCPPELVIAGVVTGTIVRACFNFLYVLALRHINRVLRRDTALAIDKEHAMV